MSDAPTHERFTLTRATWFAMEYLHSQPDGDLFEHFSPIYLFEFRPEESGKGLIDIDFWHDNYSPGVNRKTYRLQVLQRSYAYMVAVVADADKTEPWSHPTVILRPITDEWLREHHFPNMRYLESEARKLDKVMRHSH